MRRDHSKLAPYVQFIPKGRTATDAIMYKMLNRIARLNRQKIYDAAVKEMTECMLYGSSVAKVGIDFDGLRG